MQAQRLVAQVDEEAYTALGAHAAASGRSMSAELISALRLYLALPAYSRDILAASERNGEAERLFADALLAEASRQGV